MTGLHSERNESNNKPSGWPAKAHLHGISRVAFCPVTSAIQMVCYPMNYSEKLKDPRWQKKRLEILNAANWKCEEVDCGRSDLPLEVHHCQYISGIEPWQYDRDLLIALCKPCHERRQGVERSVHVALARIMRHIPSVRLYGVAWDFITQAFQESLV